MLRKLSRGQFPHLAAQHRAQRLLRLAAAEPPARDGFGAGRFSYREIADIAAIPVGTVMSRLARARKLLERAGARRSEKDD
ncbi:MAG: hypothetical protein HY057_00285 [Rhodospirillales bacterium]|nr:hypothetical protein [Rhodospirillales bacterium]